MYAYQIVGSTAKQPICRPVPVLRQGIDGPGGGSWSKQLDAAWLAANPLPALPLRKQTADYKTYRIKHQTADQYDAYDGPVMIVPGETADYSHASVTLPLYTLDDALNIRKSGTYCEY